MVTAIRIYSFSLALVLCFITFTVSPALAERPNDNSHLQTNEGRSTMGDKAALKAVQRALEIIRERYGVVDLLGIFNLMDKDGDGFVTREEADEFLASIGISWFERKVTIRIFFVQLNSPIYSLEDAVLLAMRIYANRHILSIEDADLILQMICRLLGISPDDVVLSSLIYQIENLRMACAAGDRDACGEYYELLYEFVYGPDCYDCAPPVYPNGPIVDSGGARSPDDRSKEEQPISISQGYPKK